MYWSIEILVLEDGIATRIRLYKLRPPCELLLFACSHIRDTRFLATTVCWANRAKLATQSH